MTADRSEPGPGELLHQIAWVRRLALALVRDPSLADDLAQQAATAWVQRRPDWAQRGTGLRAWLARAVRSMVADHARAERSRRRREVAVAEDPAAVHAALGTVDVVVRHEQQQRIAAAVHALPEPFRTTILYRFLDELSTAAVAERTGVPDATVRKRIERGLAMLRARLDSEFGADAQAVCVGLLAPQLQRHVAVRTARLMLFLRGLEIMSSKVLLGTGAALVVVAMAVLWFTGAADPDAPVAAGGRGVVVPAHEASARGEPLPIAARAERTAPAAAQPQPESGPRIHGFVFVDGVHRAPPDLAIETTLDDGALRCDHGAATWSFTVGPVLSRTSGDAELRARASTLWITSSSTVPAQVPIPTELLEHGGAFDLYLDSGRALTLRFVDERTRMPLAGLAFEATVSLELTRSRGRVLSRGHASLRRTDEAGRAVVHGLPDRGAVLVRTDFEPRERQLLMADGGLQTVRWPAQPLWSMDLTPELPRQLDATIFTVPRLGEAVASGQVPAWAIAAGEGPTSVRVMLRERAKVGTDASGLGERYVLPTDAQGAFTLAAIAPSRHVLWLARTADGAALSAIAEVTFERAGPQPSIAFVPLVGFGVTLQFTNVPAKGLVEVVAFGAEPASTRQRHACAGKPFAIELPLTAASTLQVRLIADGVADTKTAWMRQLAVHGGMARELAVDLAGSPRSIELHAEGFDMGGVRSVVLMPCRDRAVTSEERAVAICEAGRATSPVHLAPGQWLFVGDAPGIAVWGAVDVLADGTAPLRLEPRLHRVPADELRPAIRLDAVDGIGLAGLPESLRTVRVPATAIELVLPVGAQYSRLPQ